MKNRNNIDEKYKWDIGLFKTDEEIESVFKAISYLIQEQPKYKGQFNNPDKFFEFEERFKKEEILISKFDFYLSNSYNIDNSDPKILELISRFEIAMSKLNRETSFVSPQIANLDKKYLTNLLLDPRAKNLNNYIENIIKNKPHRLDEKTTDILSKLDNSFANSETVFDIMTNSEMKFDDAIDSKGKKHRVNDSLYSPLISSSDRKLRETAFVSLMNGYGQFNKTLAELYLKDVKSDNDYIKLRKYNTTLEYSLNSEDIPMKVYENNIKNVVKNIPLLQKYIKLKNKLSGYKNYSYYDLFEKNKNTKKISIEQAIMTIKQALLPLGNEYLSLVDKKFNDRSIDYMPCENKNSGGYCSNCYDTKTLILMNWNDNYNSMSTLAHEMGHCVNAEFFNSYQPVEKAGITIFAAEIASIVNEILLNLYMQNNCIPSQKAMYVCELLDRVRSTIYRQTLFSEFEQYTHTEIENDRPLIYKDLNKKYYELNQKYYASSCKLPKELAYEWSRIPHFYNSFYVYSYSTGLITAISIVSKILEDSTYAKKYIKFLKNGIDKKPIEILQEIGIDLTTDEPFDTAFKFIEKQLELYKSLNK